MEEKLKRATELLVAEFKKEFGEDVALEEGDLITGVFHDGLITMSRLDGDIHINIFASIPYQINTSLGLFD